MTHEELLREMYEVCEFLERKREELKEKSVSREKSEDLDDSWGLYMLKTVCDNGVLLREFDRLSGYRKSVSELSYIPGDGVRKAKSTGCLKF